ncbi:MAG: GNAT family N-acetyltransferase [Sphingobacteriaceae bacterium]|nr:GNAT family N-acetyltransferase [Cytophagaceae bacterium]
MKIRHLPNVAIHRAAYDACVEAAPNGLIYGLSWWLDVVSPGWEVLVLDDYRAVMPLPVKRRYGIRFVEQPLFCPMLGIFSGETLTPQVVVAFWQRLQSRVRLVTRLCLTEPRPISPASQRRHTHLLDLSHSYETLRAGFSRDRLQNLRRAERIGWEIQERTDIRPLLIWFRENHTVAIAGGVAPGAYALLERLVDETQRRGLSMLWYAEKNGQSEAGVWFVCWKGRVIYLFNAATPAGRRGNARTFLLDRFFRLKAGQPLIFDFESPEVASIAGFYESFGAKPQPYTQLGYNRLPGWVNAVWVVKKWMVGVK